MRADSLKSGQPAFRFMSSGGSSVNVPGSAHHGIASVKQRHRRDHDAAVRQSFRVNHSGEIVRAVQFDFQTGDQHLLHQRQSDGVGWVDMLQQCFTVIDRAGERDHPGREHIIRRQLAGFHDIEAAHHIRNEAVHPLEISNVVPGERGIGFLQLGRAQRDVAIVELFRGEKFSRGRRRQGKPLGRIDLVQLL